MYKLEQLCTGKRAFNVQKLHHSGDKLGRVNAEAITTFGGGITAKVLRQPLVITGCSSRKALPPKLKPDFTLASQSEVEADWLSQLAAYDPDICAADLYKGRAFSIAKLVARDLAADLMILSAGLGAVMSSTRIPSYDITFGRGGLKASIDRFDIHAWWRAVRSGPFSADVGAALEGRPFVLVCLSCAYSPLISDELESRRGKLKFRIFGEGLEKVLSSTLMSMVVKYDARLNLAGSPGTKSDFAQRAMRHYTSLCSDPCSNDPEADAGIVASSLARFPKPETPLPNRAVRDEEIISRVRSLTYLGLSKSKMLRYFRDIERIACEQSRFARLYDLAVHAPG